VRAAYVSQPTSLVNQSLNERPGTGAFRWRWMGTPAFN
jgi:hypothetical protein